MAVSPSGPSQAAPLLRSVPVVFVLLWSTGFIGARLVLPYSEPFTVLTLRFLGTVAVLLPLTLAMKARWPKTLTETAHIALAGVLVHAGYLGGVFAAIKMGMPAGLASLIVGLQPVLTAVLAGPLLGERLVLRQWGGLLLGLGGVIMVLGEKVAPQADSLFQGFGIDAVGCALLALVGITCSTLYQKRFCQGMDLRSGSVIQFAAAGVVMAPFAIAFETMRISWTGEFIFGLAWLVLVLSVGAVSLLLYMIRLGAASRVASLFYLVPPVTAVVAWLLFDETMGILALVGMAVAAAGVALVVAPVSAKGQR